MAMHLFCNSRATVLALKSATDGAVCSLFEEKLACCGKICRQILPDPWKNLPANQTQLTP
jgi:hypothetical protein